jgi:hypothetical protein
MCLFRRFRETVLLELRMIHEHQHHIIEKQRIIMALVKVDQTVLDAIGDTLSGILTAVEEIVADESNPLQDADLTKITGPVTALQEVLTRPTEPVEPETPETPETPAEPETPASE